MIVTLGEMCSGAFRFWDEHISADGAWSILALDSMLLIPLIFAMFFFPRVVLIGVGAAALLTVAAIGLRRVVHPRH